MIIFILKYLGLGLLIIIGMSLVLLYDSKKTKQNILDESKIKIEKIEWYFLLILWLIWPLSLIIIVINKIYHENKTII